MNYHWLGKDCLHKSGWRNRSPLRSHIAANEASAALGCPSTAETASYQLYEQHCCNKADKTRSLVYNSVREHPQLLLVSSYYCYPIGAAQLLHQNTPQCSYFMFCSTESTAGIRIVRNHPQLTPYAHMHLHLPLRLAVLLLLPPDGCYPAAAETHATFL